MKQENNKMESVRYWHFTGAKLRDGSPIPEIGKWLEVTGELVPCKHGLHASQHPFDALQFAPGSILHLVELGGNIMPHGTDKVVANRRKIIKSFDVTELLQDFARKQAWSVIGNWNPPAVVIEYLQGNKSVRSAAESAAESAAWFAAESAARDMFLSMINSKFGIGE